MSNGSLSSSLSEDPEDGGGVTLTRARAALREEDAAGVELMCVGALSSESVDDDDEELIDEEEDDDDDDDDDVCDGLRAALLVAERADAL